MKKKALILIIIMLAIVLTGCNKKEKEEQSESKPNDSGIMEYDYTAKINQEKNLKNILGFELVLPDAYSYQSNNSQTNKIKVYTLKMLSDKLSISIINDSIKGQLPTSFINIDNTFINDKTEQDAGYVKISISKETDTDFYIITVQYR